jgi:hypothetical protein
MLIGQVSADSVSLLIYRHASPNDFAFILMKRFLIFTATGVAFSYDGA